MARYDLAIVGAGIIGLAHAYMAARRGKRVVVLDRDAQANGASIRNFGFVVVTGQGPGDHWSLARRSRDVWAEVAEAAGIAVLQRGAIVAVRYAESEAVIDAFLASERGQGCAKLGAHDAAQHVPNLRQDRILCALHSPHELRVESRTAIPRLAAYLAEQHGVTFLWESAVREVEPPRLVTSRGIVEAEAVIVCPGDDFHGLFAERLAAYRPMRCKLQMMRLRQDDPIRMGSAVMSDLNLARSPGYAAFPEVAALRRRLEAEEPDLVANGIHLIVTQSADGSLVVGDSHHYADTPDPFSSPEVDALILAELERVLDVPGYRVAQRWIGTYASAPDRWRLTDRPSDAIRLVVVTSGSGASTCFGIAEETIADLYGA